MAKEKPFVTSLAGIVPIAGQPLDYGAQWHPALTLLERDYSAVERAVVECAAIGCQTIWIICEHNIQPILKYRLGDMIADPMYYYTTWKNINNFRFPDKFKQRRPIYHVALLPEVYERYNSLTWSAIYGAHMVNRLTSNITGYIKPKDYYVAWPYGVYEPVNLRKVNRRSISNKNYLLQTPNGETVCDGAYTGFKCSFEDMVQARKIFLDKTTLGSHKDHKGDRHISHSKDEAYSGKHFEPGDVFHFLEKTKHKKHKLNTYDEITTWEGYENFMKNKKKRLYKHYIYFEKNKVLYPIAVENKDL